MGDPDIARKVDQTKPNLIPFPTSFRSKSKIILLFANKPDADISY